MGGFLCPLVRQLVKELGVQASKYFTAVLSILVTLVLVSLHTCEDCSSYNSSLFKYYWLKLFCFEHAISTRVARFLSPNLYI